MKVLHSSSPTGARKKQDEEDDVFGVRSTNNPRRGGDMINEL
jgi:hypothetical protein